MPLKLLIIRLLIILTKVFVLSSFPRNPAVQMSLALNVETHTFMEKLLNMLFTTSCLNTWHMNPALGKTDHWMQ